MTLTLANRENIVYQIEKFVNRFIVWSDEGYALVIALWVLHTHSWIASASVVTVEDETGEDEPRKEMQIKAMFRNLPYLNITALTKRSGKSTLLTIIEWLSANARKLTAITGATMRRIITTEHPVVLFDEAEGMSGEAASMMRQILAAGYEAGIKVPFPKGKTGVEYCDVFCPKAFSMIGDIQDVIRDRSIVLNMVRSMDAREELMPDLHQDTAAEMREEISILVNERLPEIREVYLAYSKPGFLEGREWQIWRPLFTLCKVFCPDRLTELTRVAVDMSRAKTADARRFNSDEARDMERKMQGDEDRRRLVLDCLTICEKLQVNAIPTAELLDQLKAQPEMGWRTWRSGSNRSATNNYSVSGVLDAHQLRDMLQIAGVVPKAIRVSARKGVKGTTKSALPENKKQRKNGDVAQVFRGYTKESLLAARDAMGLK